jgi:hypothetical protein
VPRAPASTIAGAPKCETGEIVESRVWRGSERHPSRDEEFFAEYPN